MLSRLSSVVRACEAETVLGSNRSSSSSSDAIFPYYLLLAVLMLLLSVVVTFATAIMGQTGGEVPWAAGCQQTVFQLRCPADIISGCRAVLGCKDGAYHPQGRRGAEIRHRKGSYQRVANENQ
jgi:hypothetical protein